MYFRSERSFHLPFAIQADGQMEVVPPATCLLEASVTVVLMDGPTTFCLIQRHRRSFLLGEANDWGT